MKIQRSNKKPENKNNEFFIIKIVYEFHVNKVKLFIN